MDRKVTIKLRELVEKSSDDLKKNKTKIGLYSTLLAFGIIFVSLSPIALVDNIVRGYSRWNMYLVLMVDFIIVGMILTLSAKVRELEQIPLKERIEAASVIANYIEKGSEFKITGDLNGNFSIEIDELDKITFNVDDELIKSSGVIEGTYVNKYGYERVLPLNIDDVIKYEDEEVSVNEMLIIKVLNDKIVEVQNQNKIVTS